MTATTQIEGHTPRRRPRTDRTPVPAVSVQPEAVPAVALHLPPPTEAEIRAAVLDRLNHPTDHYARPDDWLAYLSDGLRAGVWPRIVDEEGTAQDEDPELARLADAAEERLRPAVAALAVDEFTAAGILYATSHPEAPWFAGDGDPVAATGNAPTRAEIITAIEVSADKRRADIGGAIYAYTAPLAFEVPAERGPAYGGCLWDNLRPSEAERLTEHLETVYAIEDRIEAMIVEAVTAAALAFAAEYPDVPRATEGQVR